MIPLSNGFLKKIIPICIPAQGILRPNAPLIFYTWWVLCPAAWVGGLFMRIKAGQFMWFLWILCSYLSHHCVFVYALFISPNTSSLVSCSRQFYSLSWHFSQGFISHFLFQFLKFLSPASWGFGCIEKVIRILTGWGRKPDVPRAPFPPHFCSDSGSLRVLSSPRALPHVWTWGASFLWEWTWGFLLRQPQTPEAGGDVGIWGFV